MLSNIKNSSTLKIKQIFTYIIYIFINSLFIIKYSSRLDGVNEYLLTSAYVAVITFFLLLYKKTEFKTIYKPLFFIFCTLIFIVTIYLNITVDGTTLNVDRWSAMDVGIKALFNGDYPYSAADHLQGRTSNFPSLLFIGIPFYLMGNIAYLQSFAFLLFSFTIYISFDNFKDKLLCIILLSASPSYLWEIYAKSDLMSNFIIILFFLVIIQNRITKGKKVNYLLLSFLSTSLFLTRITAIIPISILVFKYFYKYNTRQKIYFIILSILTIVVFSYICLHNADNLEHIKRHNPFELQNRQLPMLISLIIIVIPLFYSFKTTNIVSIINASTFFLFLPVSLGFLFSLSRSGIYLSVFDSFFDISYFNMALPFLLFSLTFNYRSSLKPIQLN